MSKIKAKEFVEKNKVVLFLVGGIVVGVASVAIGYTIGCTKGTKRWCTSIMDVGTFRLDKPTALKDLIGNDEILDKICNFYGCTKSHLLGGITFWNSKIIET